MQVCWPHCFWCIVSIGSSFPPDAGSRPNREVQRHRRFHRHTTISHVLIDFHFHTHRLYTLLQFCYQKRAALWWNYSSTNYRLLLWTLYHLNCPLTSLIDRLWANLYSTSSYSAKLSNCPHAASLTINILAILSSKYPFP